MTMSDELQKLEALLHNGTLTPDEFQVAKQRVLHESPVAASESELAEIRAQLALGELERAWSAEREKYLIPAGHGHQSEPRNAMLLVYLVLISSFGILAAMVVIAAQHGPQVLVRGMYCGLSFFCLYWIAMMLWWSVSLQLNFERYQQAYKDFQRRRRELQGLGQQVDLVKWAISQDSVRD